MKTMFVIAVFLAWAGSIVAWDYGDSYEQGYKNGARQAGEVIEPIPPIAPIAPIPELGLSSNQDGYDRGVIDGYHDEKEGRSWRNSHRW